MAHQTPEQRALAQAGGKLLPDGISIGGWSVRARRGPIIGDKLLESYSRALGNVLTLPEMLFGNSTLTLTHEASGVSITFNALDALQQWKQEGLPPLKVNIAGQWQAAREAEIKRQQAVLLDYDWTYTTPYTGTLQHGSSQPKPPQQPVPQWQPKQQQQQQEEGQQEQTSQRQQGASPQAPESAAADQPAAATAPASSSPSTDAIGTATDSPAADGAAAGTAPAAEPGLPLPEWQPTEQQIDRSLLMQREPILFYSDVPLYESELDDNGVSLLSVRVRVMAKCWFVLLRLFLRVDGTLVRLRETRLFCRLDDPQLASTVLREVKHCEGTYDELRKAGAATPGSSFHDPDAAAASFSAIAPVCTTHFELHKLQL